MIMVEDNNDELSKIIKSIGSKIFLARKNSRKKIDSISKITKIRSSYLIAIEEGRLESLPDKVYLKGFLKTYANFFGINIISELNSLDNYFNIKIEEKKKITKQSTLSEPLPNQKIYIAIFFITIVFLIIYNEYRKSKVNDDMKSLNENILEEKKLSIDETDDLNDNDSSLIEVELEKIQVLNKEEIKESNESNFENVNDIKLEVNNLKNKLDEENVRKVRINFFDQTWIQIRSEEDTVVKSGIYNMGDFILLDIGGKDNDFYIDTGNAGGFEILLDGEVLPKIGQAGSVKKNVSIKEVYDDNLE